MAQSSHADDAKPAKLHPADVYEGDRVFMGINLHGDADDYPGFYNRPIFQYGVTGEVIDAPDPESVSREAVSDGKRPMVDYAVRTDDGEVFRWNVDNGYVLGHMPSLGRRTDVGKFGGFYEAE